MAEKVTISVIKADVGGWPGHSFVHPDLIAIGNTILGEGKNNRTINDFHVTNCGDDLELIMTHDRGVDSK